MKVYRIKDSKIIGIFTKEDTYELQKYEYSGNFKKPYFNGSEIIETWTQQDEDNLTEYTKETEANDKLNKREADGLKYFRLLRNFIKRKYDDNVINETQFKTIRVNLSPALQPLKDGDFDIAQDNINAITRPSGALGVLYDRVKEDIDNYIIENY